MHFQLKLGIIVSMRQPSLILLLLACAACAPTPATPGEGESGTSATTSETESGSTSPETETDGGEGMETGIPSPSDLGSIVECDILAQDCAVGDKCVPFSAGGGTWDDYKCVPVLGDQATGESCNYDGIVEATDDCDASGFCFEGTCHAFCTGTLESAECPEGQYCSISSGPLVLCLSICDPTMPDCAEDEGCYWLNSNFTCAPTLEPAGGPGEACEFTNACDPGSICIDAPMMPDCDSTGCCGVFCELGLGDMQCADVPGTTCVGFWEEEMAPEGFEHVGVCMLPP